MLMETEQSWEEKVCASRTFWKVGPWLLLLSVGLFAPPVGAQGANDYPNRTIRIVVPYAPGGPTDVITRLVAQRLSEHVGKQFFVENVGGAGGNIGMGRAAKATPDGYTALVVNPSYAINPTLYDKVPYEFEKDFDPIRDKAQDLLWPENQDEARWSWQKPQAKVLPKGLSVRKAAELLGVGRPALSNECSSTNASSSVP